MTRDATQRPASAMLVVLWKAESTAAGEDPSDAMRKGIGLVACLLMPIQKVNAPFTLASGTQLALTSTATMSTVTAVIAAAAAHFQITIRKVTGVAASSRL